VTSPRAGERSWPALDRCKARTSSTPRPNDHDASVHRLLSCGRGPSLQLRRVGTSRAQPRTGGDGGQGNRPGDVEFAGEFRLRHVGVLQQLRAPCRTGGFRSESHSVGSRLPRDLSRLARAFKPITTRMSGAKHHSSGRSRLRLRGVRHGPDASGVCLSKPSGVREPASTGNPNLAHASVL
jgi:hypothetical protein